MAISAFVIKEDAVILKQEFTEDTYYCASAVAVGVTGKKFRIRQNNENGGIRPGIEGRKSIIIGMENETETRICLEPGPGNFDVFISSASTFDPAVDVAEEALKILRQAEETGPIQLKAKAESFWSDLWERSYMEPLYRQFFHHGPSAVGHGGHLYSGNRKF
jgi:hypothetical protein